MQPLDRITQVRDLTIFQLQARASIDHLQPKPAVAKSSGTFPMSSVMSISNMDKFATWLFISISEKRDVYTQNGANMTSHAIKSPYLTMVIN